MCAQVVRNSKKRVFKCAGFRNRFAQVDNELDLNFIALVDTGIVPRRCKGHAILHALVETIACLDSLMNSNSTADWLWREKIAHLDLLASYYIIALDSSFFSEHKECVPAF